MAAERMAVAIGDIRMIAAHTWDIAGARQAGYATAFVARPGRVLDPLALPPDIVGAN
jgi:2-haloacid dehalogenase